MAKSHLRTKGENKMVIRGRALLLSPIESRGGNEGLGPNPGFARRRWPPVADLAPSLETPNLSLTRQESSSQLTGISVGEESKTKQTKPNEFLSRVLSSIEIRLGGRGFNGGLEAFFEIGRRENTPYKEALASAGHLEEREGPDLCLAQPARFPLFPRAPRRQTRGVCVCFFNEAFNVNLQ